LCAPWGYLFLLATAKEFTLNRGESFIKTYQKTGDIRQYLVFNEATKLVWLFLIGQVSKVVHYRRSSAVFMGMIAWHFLC
jgi:hypothetical protein